MNDKEITITIYEGRPQRVTKLPKGYRLKIIDYDTKKADYLEEGLIHSEVLDSEITEG